jgi:NADPH:quinone reductase-like Zn-dependent oxidoreductase
MPLAFCTAVYALVEQAKLLEGETLLVHDAASAAGQAALSVAQMIGAQVWATVRSNEEKSLLMFEHGIPEHQIWFVGGEAFAESIGTATNGRGVDVVLNTLAGTDHRSRATWNCIAAFGRFINVGDVAATAAEVSLQKHAVFIPVDIFALAKYREHVLRRTLTHVARLLQYGLIQTTNQIKTFGISECAAALHSIRKAGPWGEFVIAPRNDEFVSVSAPLTITGKLSNQSKAPHILNSKKLLRKDATYVLIGGTGGLGRSIAKWMVGKGARNIVLLSRSGHLPRDSEEQIALLNKAGANIVVRCCDVADRASVDNLLSVALSGLPPVRGVVHGAMVLRVSRCQLYHINDRY